MDQVTSEMCKGGSGGLGYARVLVEVDVNFLNKIEINYVDAQKNVKMSKCVKVKYTWKPDRCNYYNVFGHSINQCKTRPSNNIETEKHEVRNMSNMGGNKDGFVEVRNSKNRYWNNRGMNNTLQGNKQKFQRNNDLIQGKYIAKLKVPNAKSSNVEKNNNTSPIKDQNSSDSPRSEKRWKITLERKEKEEKEESDEEDVYENENQDVNNIIIDEVLGSVDGCISSWIVIGWNSDLINMMVIHSCRQTILCLIELVDKKSIASIHSWTLMGDFNVILKLKEQSNGSSCLTSDMSEFRDAVNSLEIDDLCSSGFNFTWTKSLKNLMTSTLKKLDRILTNEGFMKVYNKAHGVFLPYIISDHSHAILVFPKGLQKKRKGDKGCKMYRVVQKLKSLKKPLRKLSWKNGNIFEKVHEMKLKLALAQSNLDADPLNKSLKGMVVQIRKDYNDAAEEELKLLHKKAKVYWLKEGDKNFAYFYSIPRARKNKSRVETICKEDGSRVDGSEVPDQFRDQMIIPIVSSKRLGAAFGSDICMAIREFFQNERILGEINATLIALVPKIDTPNKVLDFRPITCCNVLYKCISKILTNRINYGLSKVISLNQSAFIPERHIQDNILVAQGLLKGYNKKNGARRCVMKIDIQKAYNTVNWDFLRENIAVAPSFKYHYGCKDLKLTHMCFADDLMILCDVDECPNIDLGKTNQSRLVEVIKQCCKFPVESIYYCAPKKDLSKHLKPLRNDEELAMFIKTAFNNRGKVDLFVKHHGYDVIAEYVGLENVDEELDEELVDGKYIRNKDVNANLGRKCTSLTPGEIDDRFKAKSGKVYPVYDPNVPWNQIQPLLGMKFEHPKLLKEWMINHEKVDEGSKFKPDKGKQNIDEGSKSKHVKAKSKVNPKSKGNPKPIPNLIVHKKVVHLVELEVETLNSRKTVFKRMYVCFKAMKDGWSRGFKKVIGLDGLVGIENAKNWAWFVHHMSQDFNLAGGAYLTIISDGHKVKIDKVHSLPSKKRKMQEKGHNKVRCFNQIRPKPVVEKRKPDTARPNVDLGSVSVDPGSASVDQGSASVDPGSTSADPRSAASNDPRSDVSVDPGCDASDVHTFTRLLQSVEQHVNVVTEMTKAEKKLSKSEK
nr:hypothetical protein [Tanacetum cinerariifolium]